MRGGDLWRDLSLTPSFVAAGTFRQRFSTPGRKRIAILALLLAAWLLSNSTWKKRKRRRQDAGRRLLIYSAIDCLGKEGRMRQATDESATARNAIAWANGPGQDRPNIGALKVRK